MPKIPGKTHLSCFILRKKKSAVFTGADTCTFILIIGDMTMKSIMIHSFLQCLILTVVIETPVLWLIIRKLFNHSEQDVATRHIVAAGITASSATYPYLWYVAPAFAASELEANLIGEPLVILAETFILWSTLRLSVFQSFQASLICNFVTILFGIVLVTL